MPEVSSRQTGWKRFNAVAFAVVVLGIAFTIWLALNPALFVAKDRGLLKSVTIFPEEAAVSGAQWRLVSQWQDAGDFDTEQFYLLEFKSVPGWEAPAPKILRRGEIDSEIEAIYRSVKFETQTILTLAGGITIAQGLGPELGKLYLKHIGADEVRVLPGREPGSTTLEGIFYLTREIKSIEFEGGGTPSGFEALRDGRCDIGMAAQGPSAALGDFLEQLGEGHIIGMDAVSVIVNRSNPIHKRGLSAAQVRGIFSGEITNWSEVGGDPAPIKVFALRDTFGARGVFESAFMQGTSLVSTALDVDDHFQMPELVSQDPFAVGFCSLAFVQQGSREVPIRATETSEAVLPTLDAIRNGSYPVTRDLALYIRPGSKNIYAMDFVRLAKGTAGQEIVRRFGFVDQGRKLKGTPAEMAFAGQAPDWGTGNGGNAAASSPVGANVSVGNPSTRQDTDTLLGPLDLPGLVQLDGEVVPDSLRREVIGAFQGMVSGAEHLPSIFHFELSSTVLDKESLAEVDRVLELLRSPERKGRGLVLVGFSDTYGNYQANLEISKKRAEALARVFREKGGNVTAAIGAGEESPLESNADRAGRRKNRRVEIWVK